MIISSCTEISNGVLYVKGMNTTLNRSVMIGINNYEQGNHSYIINNTGIGINVNGSNAQYQNGGYVYVAGSGHITTSGGTNQTVTGTFDFAGGGAHVNGSFVAAAL